MKPNSAGHRSPRSRQGQANLLGKAILADSPAKVRALLAAGVSPDSLVWDWDSALYLAVKLRRARAVHTLLAGGASPTPSPTGRVPLATAAEHGSLDLIEALLAHGAPVDHTPDPHSGFTSLEFAVLGNRPDIVSRLCAAGANPNLRIKRCFDLRSWPRHIARNWVLHEFLYQLRKKRRLQRLQQWEKLELAKARLITWVPVLLAAIASGAGGAANALLANGAKKEVTDSDGRGWEDYAHRHECWHPSLIRTVATCP